MNQWNSRNRLYQGLEARVAVGETVRLFLQVSLVSFQELPTDVYRASLLVPEGWEQCHVSQYSCMITITHW